MKLLRVIFVVAVAAAWCQSATAQLPDSRIGLGVNALASTADGLGVGLRGRLSMPINADISAAADFGVTGFVLGGRRNADYILDPQISAIVTLPPGNNRVGYVLFGLGGYIPVGGGEGGPTLHAGFGRAHALQESSYYYEINPALVIGREGVDLAVPLRFGIIL